jgi:hypothetical protein
MVFEVILRNFIFFEANLVLLLFLSSYKCPLESLAWTVSEQPLMMDPYNLVVLRQSPFFRGDCHNKQRKRFRTRFVLGQWCHIRQLAWCARNSNCWPRARPPSGRTIKAPEEMLHEILERPRDDQWQNWEISKFRFRFPNSTWSSIGMAA